MMNKLKAGDNVYFACGGIGVVREVEVRDGCYPIRIKLEGYHAGDDYWAYDGNGENGDSTGPDGIVKPFDIIHVRHI